MTEADFYKRLDNWPNDWECRLVFADWLEERGEVGRSFGQRWQAENGKHVAFKKGRVRWYTYYEMEMTRKQEHDDLVLPCGLLPNDDDYHDTQREADLWLAEQLIQVKELV